MNNTKTKKNTITGYYFRVINCYCIFSSLVSFVYDQVVLRGIETLVRSLSRARVDVGGIW